MTIKQYADYGYSSGRFIAAILSRTVVEGFALGPMIS